MSAPVCRQPTRDLGGGQYARTTARGVNVRGYDGRTNRLRGGSRTGLTKLLDARVAGTPWVVQNLTTIVGTGYTPPGGQTMQASQSGRVVSLVAVSQGNVYSIVPGGPAWVAATNSTMETPPLNAIGLMFSSALNQLLFFADGINAVYFSPADNAVRQWIPTAGSLPVDSANNRPRLICTWRGRLVQSGLLLDPHNWFMSRVSDPFDWATSPSPSTPDEPVAGNDSPLGLIGDVVTALVPWSDDVLIMGCDHEIWRMLGDPMAGGQLSQVTKAIGFAWGEAWCMDPVGNVYFLSNHLGVYRMAPNGLPERISSSIDNLIQDINTGTTGVRMVWSDRFQGFHMFVTPLVAPAAATHYFFEVRSGAWWQDKFVDPNMDPLCCCTFDGNLPGDRLALTGGWDGYVRVLDPDAADDDGEEIRWEVLIGPLLTNYYDDVMVDELQAVIADGSGDVTCSILLGRTAEAALASSSVKDRVWVAGRNATTFIRRAAHALYIKLAGFGPAAVESIRVVLGDRGEIRRRAKR